MNAFMGIVSPKKEAEVKVEKVEPPKAQPVVIQSVIAQPKQEDAQKKQTVHEAQQQVDLYHQMVQQNLKPLLQT